MNELMLFQKEEFGQVRVVEHNGEPWFVAKDVLKSLGYAGDYNPSRALQGVPEEWKGVQPIHTPGGIQAQDVHHNGNRQGARIPQCRSFQSGPL